MEIITSVGEFCLTHVFGNINEGDLTPPTMYKVLVVVIFAWFVVNSSLWWYDYVTAKNGEYFSKFSLLAHQSEKNKEESTGSNWDMPDLITNRCIIASAITSVFCLLLLTMVMFILAIILNMLPIYVSVAAVVLLTLVVPTIAMRRAALKPIKVEEKLKYGVD